MRVVIDTNVLVSALISSKGNPAIIYDACKSGKFTLLSCAQLMEELRATLRKPKVSALIRPYEAGRLVNQLSRLTEDVGRLPTVKRSPDPEDDFLLAMCEAGRADYLVTGDKKGLLALRRHQGTRIFSPKQFAALWT